MRLGVIGYGYRISLFFKELLKKNPLCHIVAIADLNPEGVKEKLSIAGYPLPRFYTNADEMLNTEQLDGVLIGTRCSTHTEMALKVLQHKLPLVSGETGVNHSSRLGTAAFSRQKQPHSGRGVVPAAIYAHCAAHQRNR